MSTSILRKAYHKARQVKDWGKFQKELYDFRKKLRPYYNKHSGESCIITACGPSLEHLPEELFEKYMVIGVNASYRKIMPDYMTIIDTKLSWVPEARKIANEQSILLFISWTWGGFEFRSTVYDNEITMPFKRFPVDYGYKGYPYREWLYRVYNNPCRLEDGVTSNISVVPESAIPLALYMGFDKIYLAGVDFSFPKGKKHFYKDSEEDKKALSLQSELEKKREGQGDIFVMRMFVFDILAASVNRNRIFNLNPDSAVRQFEFVDWKIIL